MEFNILHDNVGFIGFSFGGNIGIATAAIHGNSIEQDLKYVIQWETPVSSQVATRDLGRMLFRPLEKGGSVQSEYFNPRYISYGPLTINVNYSDITYDPDSLYAVFHDGNNDGVYTTINGTHHIYPTPDLNENNILELNEDYGIDTYPYSTYDIVGKKNIRLTNNSIRKYDLKFSVNGDYLFFNSEQSQDPCVIYKSWLLNISTRELKQLDEFNNNYTDFSIGPDQTKIMYVGAKIRSANEPIDIYIMNWNMDKTKKITNGGIYYNSIFNKDGTKIVYRHIDDWNKNYEIRLIEDNTGNWGV